MQSYLTVQEANERISAFLPSTDALRAAWEALSDEDKQSCIFRATARIDTLPYTGAPACAKQDGAFPRWGESELSEEVKTAVALEACACCDAEADIRATLQAQGVKSFSVGSLSESYKVSSGGGGLYHPTAQQLLSKYLMGAHLCL